MQQTIAVIGTVFVDCKGFSSDRYNPDTRNLGTIGFVHGGVGRNVVENLSNMDLNTYFISSIDQSALGKDVLDRLEKAQVNTKYIHQAEQNGMGMWLAILDQQGDLAGSISQMPNLEYIKNIIDTQGDTIIQQSDYVVLELDLNAEISRKVIDLAKQYNKPVYGIPGNLEVVLSAKDLLLDLDCFICNHFEAERLLEHSIEDLSPQDMQRVVKQCTEQLGLQSMVITMGAQGSVYYDSKTEETGYQEVFPVNLVDSSGAGDAFFSGTVMGLIRGLSLKDAVVCGSKVASWTIEQKENNCQSLKEDMAKDERIQSFFVPA